ncbi:MAG: hypothetical protein II541_00780, partial [Prevotella sp.]|nr:hypothetical protein [Prevotella sp.]
MRHFLHILPITLLSLLIACTPTPDNQTKLMKGVPNIYPDYTDVTIPPNIAPLNFLMRDDVDAVECIVECGEYRICVNESGNEICFKERDWKKLMQEAKGKDIHVTLSARYN